MLYLNITGSAPLDVKESVESALLTAFNPPKFIQKKQEKEEINNNNNKENKSSFHLLIDLNDIPLQTPQQTPYDCRFIWTPLSSIEEVITEVKSLLFERNFISTRGAENISLTFLSVVRDGLAPDGGLFNLKNIPIITNSQLHYFCTVPVLSYIEAAQLVLERLVDNSMQPELLYKLIVEAYTPGNWSNLNDICPLTELIFEDKSKKQQEEKEKIKLNTKESLNNACWNNISLLELYHGPTAAFKDFALQLFPRYFDIAASESINTVNKNKNNNNNNSNNILPSYVMLTATSGDTGVAAISGFVNSGSSTRVMVLYPFNGVSPVQQMQMLSYDNGNSVRVFGVNADFDFCQNSVKQIFANHSLAQKLWNDLSVRLSSANSINWGRLIPQVVYYFWAYRKLVKNAAEKENNYCNNNFKFGDVFDIVVPCGNFGNILAAFFAKRMGLPVGKLIVASNQNDVLYEFVQTGNYDIRHRQLTQTASPSIDILKASNIERFLFLLFNGNTSLVKEYMLSLEKEKYFKLSNSTFNEMKEIFWSAHCTEVECANIIKEIFESTGRLIDPHTAVATFAAKQFRAFQENENKNKEDENNEKQKQNKEDENNEKQNRPLVIASTAHWAKFPLPVLHALRGEDITHTEESLKEKDIIKTKKEKEEIHPASACKSLYNEILKHCSNNVEIHPALSAALASAELTEITARRVEANVNCVQEELINFISY